MPKTETKADEESAADGSADAPRGDGAGGSNDPVTRGDVANIVEELVPRIVDELLGDDGTGGEGDGDASRGSDGGSGTPEPPARVESSVAAEVARELGRIRTAEQTTALADEVKEIREKIAEKPPLKVKRVTRWFWGDA